MTRPGPETAATDAAVHPEESAWLRDFRNPAYEIRRVFAELLGTFLLVVAGAGASVVAVRLHEDIGRGAEVTAPALVVLAVILFMGKVSGAHINPVVTVAFALRREFPWRRVPGYIAVQLLGAVLAGVFLLATFGSVAHLGATEVAKGLNDLQAVALETFLTFGLVSTILGTASGAQNVGSMSAVGVAGYIAAAGLWSSPATGASMNPARSFGPAVVSGYFDHFWVYAAGPLLGALAAVGAAVVLRGPGGDRTARENAGGT